MLWMFQVISCVHRNQDMIYQWLQPPQSLLPHLRQGPQQQLPLQCDDGDEAQHQADDTAEQRIQNDTPLEQTADLPVRSAQKVDDRNHLLMVTQRSARGQHDDGSGRGGQ